MILSELLFLSSRSLERSGTPETQAALIQQAVLQSHTKNLINAAGFNILRAAPPQATLASTSETPKNKEKKREEDIKEVQSMSRKQQRDVRKASKKQQIKILADEEDLGEGSSTTRTA